jgi:hypothetical protein
VLQPTLRQHPVDAEQPDPSDVSVVRRPRVRLSVCRVCGAVCGVVGAVCRVLCGVRVAVCAQ